jgi:hypothetical protein
MGGDEMKKNIMRYLIYAAVISILLSGSSCNLKDPAAPTDPVGDTNNPPQTGVVTNSITLKSEPGVLPADGITSSRLVATVRRKDGKVVADLLPVAFRTTEGNLSDDGFNKLGKEYTFYTVRGEAICYLISSTRDIIARIEARQGDVTAAIRIRFLRTNEDSGRVDLAYFIPPDNPSSIAPPFEVILTATVYNREGETLQDAKVTFKADPSGYGYFKNGKNEITHITDNDGEAKAIFRVEDIPADPNAPTNIKIKATSGPVWDQVTIFIAQNDNPIGILLVNPSILELAGAASQSGTVGLDATGFTDTEDGTNLIYEYSVLSNSTGCSVSIAPSSGPTTTATITANPTAIDGTIVFQVKVTDTQGGVGYDTAELAITIK